MGPYAGIVPEMRATAKGVDRAADQVTAQEDVQGNPGHRWEPSLTLLFLPMSIRLNQILSPRVE